MGVFDAGFRAPPGHWGVKVLLVHNLYRRATPSGENTVFSAEARLLAEAGHQVECFTRSNDEYADAPLTTGLTAALLLSDNPWSRRALARRIADFAPDIVHFHNTFPLLSPATLTTARASGAAVVATLHNYRTVCAQGGLLRDRKICTTCLDRGNPWAGVRHGCYRGSLASIPVAGMIAHHHRRQTWSRAPHALIVLTEFQKSVMQRAGLAAERLHVKCNFTSAAVPLPFSERAPCAVYLGRLSDEKGVWTLLEAWRLLGARAPKLRLIGAGENELDVRARIAETGISERVEWLGTLPHTRAMDELARARLLIFPSIWYEPFGLSVIEAYARAVPVLASRIGSLPELVPDGLTGALFEPGDALALARRVSHLWADPEQLERMGSAAHRAWDAHYSPGANRERLEQIYRAALAERNGPSGAPLRPAGESEQH